MVIKEKMEFAELLALKDDAINIFLIRRKTIFFFLSQAISFDVVFNYSRLGYSRNFV